MQVLAFPRLNRDFQHPHTVVLEEEAVVCGRGDQRIQMGRPFRFISPRHTAL